jgi:hypothetical protein
LHRCQIVSLEKILAMPDMGAAPKGFALADTAAFAAARGYVASAADHARVLEFVAAELQASLESLVPSGQHCMHQATHERMERTLTGGAGERTDAQACRRLAHVRHAAAKHGKAATVADLTAGICRCGQMGAPRKNGTLTQNSAHQPTLTRS